MELFKAVLKWTDSECATQGINIGEDKTARTRILGDSVHEICFLEMSHENILKDVSPTGILTDTEIVCILQKVSGLDVPGLKWKERRERQPSPLLSFNRFENAGYFFNLRNSVGSDALTFTVNKTVLFHGVRLFGDGQYEVKFKIKDENVTGTYTSQQDSDGVPGYDVMLPKPIPLLPDEEIPIVATIIKRRISCCGVNENSSVKVHDIVVTFKDGPSHLKKGFIQGQFYKVFLSEL